MAAPPSGTGMVDKFYFKNSVAKDSKATAMKKAISQKAKDTAEALKETKTGMSVPAFVPGIGGKVLVEDYKIGERRMGSGVAAVAQGYSVPKMEWAGIWASQYPSNDGKDGRVDLIRVDHRKSIRVRGEDTGLKKDDKNCIVATKLTGNRFVPAGQVSFEAAMHKNGMMGRGRALLACEGFTMPRWVKGEFHAETADTFTFHWTDDEFIIHFHRYDPEAEKPVIDENGAAITNSYLYEGRPRPADGRD